MIPSRIQSAPEAVADWALNRAAPVAVLPYWWWAVLFKSTGKSLPTVSEAPTPILAAARVGLFSSRLKPSPARVPLSQTAAVVTHPTAVVAAADAWRFISERTTS